MIDAHHYIASKIRDHQLQPRIRSEDADPWTKDYECTCGLYFLGVAEWSYHVAEVLT